jgi:hypothetical protein
MKKTYPSIPVTVYNSVCITIMDYKSKMSTLSENVIYVYFDRAAVGALRTKASVQFSQRNSLCRPAYSISGI